jgi:predicted GNAT superfamily acetyltransferase
VTEVTWTFDPLVARNAHINITRLGADVDEYLIDFYGVMADGINAGQGSDRVVVRWHLDAPYFLTDPSRAGAGLPPASFALGAKLPRSAVPPRLTVAPDGLPAVVPATASAAVTLAIPRDIEGLRQTDPARASAWRSALRVAMAPLLADGWHVTGFHPVTGYLVERPAT